MSSCEIARIAADDVVGSRRKSGLRRHSPNPEPHHVPVRTLRRASGIFRFNGGIQISVGEGRRFHVLRPLGGAGRPHLVFPAPKVGVVVVFGLTADRNGPTDFPILRGVSMGCGLLRFSGQLSDERGPGHQIECGIFQYWDVGGRHMAPKHHFGARGQCLGRHVQQLSGVDSGRHRKLPQNHRPRICAHEGKAALRWWRVPSRALSLRRSRLAAGPGGSGYRESV